MSPKDGYYNKRICLFSLLVLAGSMVTACGDNGNDSGDSGVSNDSDSGVTFSVDDPLVEGPIIEPGEPFDLGIKIAQPLTDFGYESAEFFVSGTATSYRAVNGQPIDGKWEVEQAETAPYKIRVLVYKPSDPATFNGTLLVEWLNVTAGIEAAPDYMLMHTEILRSGYAWIGVSAQKAGIEKGGPVTQFVRIQMDLKTVDPDRYGSLTHPGDSYSYDIYSQIAKAIRNPGAVDPMAGYVVNRILAIGESQSAFRLTTYINAIHRYHRLFDGFLVHSRGGNTAPLRDDTSDNIGDFSGGFKLRTDLEAPILILETETDFFELGYYTARQDDTANIKLWEMAGTSHADLYQATTGPTDDGTDPAVANVVETIQANPITQCDLPINSGPQHFIAKAALHQLDNWVRTGTAAPTANRLEIVGDPPAFVLDEFGIAKGGIRTPYVDVPIARLSGSGQPTSDDESSICFLYGTTELFNDETLAALYSSHTAYVQAVGDSTDAAVQAGFLMPEDGALIKAAAEASNVGN